MNEISLSVKPDYVAKNGHWELRVYYRSKGTKNEGAHGILLFNEEMVKAKRLNDKIATDLGLMEYYGEFPSEVKYVWDPSGWNYADKEKIKHSWDKDKK